MIEIEKIASNLVKTPDGFWTARNISAVSYPVEGNALCYEVEETSFWFRHRNTSILQVVRAFPPAGAVVDIGGGNGFVSAALLKAGFDVVLVEPGEGVYNARQRGLPVIIHSTLQDVGFHPETLPAAGLFDVLEHIENDLDFLQALAPLMKPEGRLYLTVPAFSWLWSVVDEDSGHYRRYSLPSLELLLEQAGFAVVYATYFFRSMLLPILMLRALPSRLGLRKNQPIEKLRGELTRSSRWMNTLLAALLSLELPALGRRCHRWGASCLLVAQRR